MRGLLYKNFLLYRVELIVIGCIQLVASATVVLLAAGSRLSEYINISYMALYFCVFLCSGLFESMMFTPDENRVTSSFIISAPGGAKGHIQSKYYTILVINLAILACCIMTDAAACAISGTTAYSACVPCLFFFCMNLLFSAFSTPFYIRFGSVYGNGAKYGVLGVLGLVVVIYALFGDITFLFGDDPVAAITEFLTSGNALLVLSLIPTASVLLYYISYLLSLKLYRKGAENYEQ